MSREYKLQAALAYDSMSYNLTGATAVASTPTIAQNAKYTLQRPLTLKLANNKEKVSIDGLVTLQYTAAGPASIYGNINIYAYRDVAQTKLAFKKELAYSTRQNEASNTIDVDLRLVWEEVPALAVGEDTANYYIVIENKIAAPASTTLNLKQYAIKATEIANNN